MSLRDSLIRIFFIRLETSTASKQESSNAIPETRQINRIAVPPGKSSPVYPSNKAITVIIKNCEV